MATNNSTLVNENAVFTSSYIYCFRSKICHFVTKNYYAAGLVFMTDIAIIIVSWNVREKLRECVRSIIDSVSAPSYKIYVVDNASNDGSAQMIREEFGAVHLIANDINLGTSKALNQALSNINSRYVLWLNPDMLLFSDTLFSLISYADTHQRAGVIGVRLENEKGEIVPHVRRFPTIIDQFFIVSKLAKLFPRLLDNYLCVNFDYSKESVVDSVRGSFFCMRYDVLKKIGQFDERFFVWFEEVDICKRVIDAGYEVRYTPTVRAIDYVGQSFAQVPVIKKQKMFILSMLKYFFKHGFFD